MDELRITLRTLTPLWTGGVDGTCDRLHETGLIGSLRWWYEALVRGLGGRACDPVEDPCPCDAEQPHGGLCPSCQVFGATGWARRFRLMIEERTTISNLDGSRQPTGNRFKKGGQECPSWYFKKGGRAGEVDLRIIPTTSDFDPIVILGTLSLIARWGSLAAKPQLGYGWIEIVSAPVWDVDGFVHKVQTAAATQPKASNGLPALNEMFFTELSTSDAGVTATLNVKFDLRAAFRTAFGGDQALRHWVCGSVRGNQRQASKINVTQAVDGHLRIWGWIPENVPSSNVTRDEIANQIKSTLTAYGKIVYWREFDSDRDTFGRQTDRLTYLSELLKEGS